MAHLKKPRAVLYREDGRNTFIRGDRGAIDTETNNVEVTDNVEIDTVDGYFIETSAIKYEKDKAIISTDADVRLTGKDFEIKGRKMTTDTHREISKIYENVEAVFYLSSGGEHVENAN